MLPVKAQADDRFGGRRWCGRFCSRRNRRLVPSPPLFVLGPLWTAHSPKHWQLKGCAHSAPPVASATAQTLTSVLRDGRPRRLRLSGVGKSFSFSSQLLQYTLPCVWARYQRQPHPSQIFKCTRNSMTISPCSRALPRTLLCHSFSSRQEKPGTAAQGSCALMGDSRPYSLVGCHAHSAQILEDRLNHPRAPLLSALGRE